MKILATIFGFTKPGEMMKIKTSITKHIGGDFNLSRRIEILKDSSVSTKRIVDIPDAVDFVPAQAIVESSAALISTKLFVWSSNVWSTAFHTSFFGNK